MTLEEAIAYYYAKGQKDYPNDWDPPVRETMVLIGGLDEYQKATLAAYMAGWKHAKSQD